MSHKNLSSAHSDDGRMKNRNRQNDQEQAFSEHRQFRAQRNGLDDAGLSVDAQLSAHEVNFAFHNEQQPISEHPEEDDRASSPAGTIYNNHDIMSENIAKNVFKFEKGKSMDRFDSIDQAETSIRASVSEMTKVSKVAEVSPAVPIENINHLIVDFESKLDGFYQEFTEKIIADYQQMRASYMQDY